MPGIVWKRDQVNEITADAALRQMDEKLARFQQAEQERQTLQTPAAEPMDWNFGGLAAALKPWESGQQPATASAAPAVAAPKPATSDPWDFSGLKSVLKPWEPKPAPAPAPAMPGQAAGGAAQAGVPAQIAPQASASAPGQYGEIDNTSRASFVRTAWPYMLEAAGGDANLAELMLAKAISENGSIGTGKPFWANNFSGLKGEGDAGSVEADTWEDYGNGRVNIRDRFAAYSTPQKGMAAFMQFLQDNPRYHGALARYRQTGNADALFDDILAAGYATDKNWANSVRNIRDTQVAPVVRGGQRQSLNAGGAPPPAPMASPGGAAGVPPASSAAPALPPSVAQAWQQRTGGAEMTDEDLQQLRMLGVVA